MIGNLRAAFIDLLEENDWMDPDTTEVAREKVIILISLGFTHLLSWLWHKPLAYCKSGFIQEILIFASIHEHRLW